jgi:predicted GIY-YIG superfamily endonuclease
VSEPTTLYRFRDSQGRLLYVGISGNPGRRFHQHSKDKPWWSQVASSTMEHFFTRDDAERAERAAIVEERPLYNVVHVPRAPKVRELEPLRCPPIYWRGHEVSDYRFDSIRSSHQGEFGPGRVSVFRATDSGWVTLLLDFPSAAYCYEGSGFCDVVQAMLKLRTAIFNEDSYSYTQTIGASTISLVFPEPMNDWFVRMVLECDRGLVRMVKRTRRAVHYALPDDMFGPRCLTDGWWDDPDDLRRKNYAESAIRKMHGYLSRRGQRALEAA